MSATDERDALASELLGCGCERCRGLREGFALGARIERERITAVLKGSAPSLAENGKLGTQDDIEDVVRVFEFPM